MRYTVILVPENGRISVLVPAMPGCYSMGRTRADALTKVREAIAGWIETEAEQGRSPLRETPTLVLDGVSQALATIEEMRAAGELPAGHGYDLELATVVIQRSAAA